ncbi:MAG: hypothetical protein ABI892_15885 [Flavobacterium sp.]
MVIELCGEILMEDGEILNMMKSLVSQKLIINFYNSSFSDSSEDIQEYKKGE